ncbi:MAG: flagellar protein export ATPase FliI [Oscillospiraceae bacterium]|nr:flagellar protein export ATPase FliI [Oscillospiraceae bacterium]
MNFAGMIERVARCDPYSYLGKIDKIVGMMVESIGPSATVGELCKIHNPDGSGYVNAEVVGFRENRVLLMPYEDLAGISPGSMVEGTKTKLKIPVSGELIGRTVDALGRPIDGLGSLDGVARYEVETAYANPLSRPRIDTTMTFGVKVIDGLLSIGKGQRMGIFAGSGVGKSTLLGMIARNVHADVNVIGLVGERGREVREFIERDLGPEGMKRSVVVVATSDQPAMLRLKCAMAATSVAEYFRDQGKDVLLMMDSLTRFAMAQREIGLASGEPPVSRGYTPSMYTAMPKLLERTGNFEKGSITGIYTVLVEGDDTNEPISDTVRGIIDGHIILSRKIAARNHYPAIDVLGSISRLMYDITDRQQSEDAGKLRNIMSIYESNYDLISIGAYKKGTNPALDMAIAKIEKINAFLQQKVDEKFGYDETWNLMKKAIAD